MKHPLGDRSELTAIEAPVLEAMAQHAQREAPLECCGILAGRNGVIDRLFEARNLLASPTRFSVDPHDLFRFFRWLRGSDREFLGVYHSHPASAAVPSQRDREEFYYRDVTYWIVSLAQGRTDIRCYRWDKMDFVEAGCRVEPRRRFRSCRLSSDREVFKMDSKPPEDNLLPTSIDVFANLRGTAPPELLAFLDQLIMLFPEELRYRLKQVMDSLPRSGDNMQKVLEVVRHQWKDIQSEQWVQIAVVGPSKTGKTSLHETIAGKQSSGVQPIFTIIETPGLQEYLGFKDAESAPRELEKVDLILLVLDARFGISDLTRQTFEKLLSLGMPVLAVLNKIDLSQDSGKAVEAAKKALQASVFPTSIYRPDTIDELLKAMVAAQPKVLYPLAQAFPEFRRTLCNSIITQASFAAGVCGVVPLPVSDLLPITAIQTAMILKISRAFGCHLDRRRARELIPMLATGIIAREAGHRLRRRFPRQRHLISVGVGGGWTFTLGKLAVRYFERVSGYLHQGDLPEELHR